MPARKRPPLLLDHLRTWGPDEVARLLARRPDLSQPDPCWTLDDLAERAANPESVQDALIDVTVAEDRLLQVIVCAPPGVALADLAGSLPDDVTLDDIEPVLASLESAALVWRHGGHLHANDALRDLLPVDLGPPFAALIAGQTVDDIRHAITAIHEDLTAAEFAGPLPTSPTRADGKAPLRSDLIAYLGALLGARDVVLALLAVAPPDAITMALALLERGGAVSSDFYYAHHRHSRYGGTYGLQTSPQQWLFERALLLPLQNRGLAFQPREVSIALLGGRPVHEMALTAPQLVTGRVEQDEVDRHGAVVAMSAVGHLSDLLDRLATTPEKLLKSGGLGVSSLKSFGADLDVDAEHAGRLVEVLHLGGLLSFSSETTKVGRKYTTTDFVVCGPAAAGWLARSPEEQWHQIATAWWRAWFWPSMSGRKDRDGRTVPVLGVQYSPDAEPRRRDVIDTLATLDNGDRTSTDALTAYLLWHRPRRWLECEAGEADDCVRWIIAEAELLGIVAHGRVTTFGAALTEGRSNGEVTKLLESALPGESTTFTLLPDLTAVVVGRLGRETMNRLRLMADVESVGAATTLRFSDGSIRRALDTGLSADDILTFLGDHADKGVPKPLAYLVTDLARRHGHLVVATASTVVTSDDPAVLADACSHRRTRKLGLRVVAPTVAIGDQPPDKVLDGLRDAGFLPTPEGGVLKIGDATATAPKSAAERAFPDDELDDGLGRRRPAGPYRPAADHDDELELPEPYRQDTRPRMSYGFPAPASPVTLEDARELALILFPTEPKPKPKPKRKASKT